MSQLTRKELIIVGDAEEQREMIADVAALWIDENVPANA
jgi:hypothetical protein